jgi:hypothetical protein
MAGKMNRSVKRSVGIFATFGFTCVAVGGASLPNQGLGRKIKSRLSSIRTLGPPVVLVSVVATPACGKEGASSVGFRCKKT